MRRYFMLAVLALTCAGQAWALGGRANPTDLADTAYKAVSEAVTNSNTLQDDNDLVVNLVAYSTYTVEGLILSTAAAAQPDLKISFAVPAGSTMSIAYFGPATNDGTFRGAVLVDSGVASAEIPATGGFTSAMNITGTVVTGANNGTLTLRWAQQTADLSSTFVHGGSYLRVARRFP